MEKKTTKKQNNGKYLGHLYLVEDEVHENTNLSYVKFQVNGIK